MVWKRNNSPVTIGKLPTFRTHLTVSFLGLVGCFGIALIGGLAYTSSRLVRSTTGTVIGAHSRHSEALVSSYFEPVQQQLFAAEHWAQTGLLSPADTQMAAQLLTPLSDSTPQISAVFLLSDENTISIVRTAEGWQTSSEPAGKSDSAGTEDRPRRRNGKGEARKPKGARIGSLEAVRGRAVKAGSGAIVWSGLVQAGSAGQVILGAKLLEGKDGRQFVLAYGITLADLSERIVSLRPSRHGFAGLLDERNGSLGQQFAAGKEAAGTEALRPPDKRALVETALREWPKNSSQLQLINTRRAGELWWIGLQPLELRGTVWSETEGEVEVGSQQSFLLATAIPQSDLFVELRNQQYALVVITVIGLILALLLGLHLANRFSAPLVTLARQSARIQRLDLAAEPGSVSIPVREIAQLANAQEQMRSALDNFSRYVPTELVRQLLDRGEAAQIGGRMAELTVLITDIRGFTRLSAELPPEKFTNDLAAYFDVLLNALREGGATVDKLTGDGVVAFWGAPHADAEQSQRAVQAALVAAQRIEQFNRQGLGEGKPEFKTHFGLSRGRVLVGNVGAHWRLNYTALGDAVNIASRVQRLNEDYGTTVLATAEVRNATGAEVMWRAVDRVTLRGRQGSVELFEPLSPDSAPELTLVGAEAAA